MGVYPRVGGGTGCCPPSNKAESGLSPRGRGNHQHASALDTNGRSIPAWAGEPMVETVQAAWDTVYPRVGGGTLAG